MVKNEQKRAQRKGDELVDGQLPFLNSLKELFHVQIDQQTSACLYGSATTGEWIPSRSDLDLFLIVPEEKLALVGQKIEIWQARPDAPKLDGFVLYSSDHLTMAREFHQFDKAVRLTESFIPLIDLWNIKNRSTHLFGKDVKTFVREIDLEELRAWALKDIQGHWIPLIDDLVSRANISSEATVPLSSLIWMASAVARMLMLTRGNVCSSKREALRSLASEHIELTEIINVLRAEFDQPDDMARTFSTEQTVKLGKIYLRLLREAVYQVKTLGAFP